MNNTPDPDATKAADAAPSDDIYRTALSFVLWTATIIWAATILWLSSLKSRDLPTFTHLVSDKFSHFMAFAVGGWLAASATRITWPALRFAKPIIAVILLGALFGAFDELFQLFTPGRSGADFYDWIADILGILTGASLTLLTHGLLERIIPRR